MSGGAMIHFDCNDGKHAEAWLKKNYDSYITSIEYTAITGECTVVVFTLNEQVMIDGVHEAIHTYMKQVNPHIPNRVKTEQKRIDKQQKARSFLQQLRNKHTHRI